MGIFDHKAIESKWQQKWSEDPVGAVFPSNQKKTYLLIEFPYPSGAGLHTGHVRSYTALDIIARTKRRQNENVLYPIGWDAFGLPTENYAIKTGRSPQEITKENTDTYRRQLQSLGISFDWDREINTTDPSYYKWTQWIFLQLYKKGLAYKAKTQINWCPKDKIGLANEEVVDGACERCGTLVEKREKEQWMLAITKYAQRLYDDLDTVDYIERAKTQQRNWIGPSEGALIRFSLAGISGQEEGKHTVEVFTTRPDTIYGATFIAVSPELARKWIAIGWNAPSDVLAYIEQTMLERAKAGRKDIEEKTGIDAGIWAINPANQEKIPVWITNYVLGEVGTGAIMAVPAHDERDFDFAKKYSLQIRYVIESTKHNGEHYNTTHQDRSTFDTAQSGFLVNSGVFNGVSVSEAKKKITESVGGTWTTTFKLRDWVFSRQRYWGEPIPMVHCEACKAKTGQGWVPIPEDQLPLTLPQVDTYTYTDTGESPLAHVTSWVETTCPVCSGPARRETDTMPNWAGSSWYYLRYTDPTNQSALASPQALAYFTPVDWYNGGMEHTVLHLLYSRFWHKFLFDLGLVPTSEPYQKRTSHGMILAENGEKMSKSKGNVVNPDEIVERFGADTLRVYEMFMGPFDQAIAWSTDGLVGARRFLERVDSLVTRATDVPLSDDLEIVMNQTIQKVTADILDLKMNTAVAALMTFQNAIADCPTPPHTAVRTLVSLIAPFAPHIAEEFWQQLQNTNSVHLADWPTADPTKLAYANTTIAIQVDGKTRGTITVPRGTPQTEVEVLAQAPQTVAARLTAAPVAKVVFIEDKLINFVLKNGSNTGP
jgi:leucyl-tRNA synthetase